MKFLMTDFVDIFHCLLLQKTQYFSNWNCLHTVVIGSGNTYLVPRWRICYSQPPNSSVHASQPVTSLWLQTQLRNTVLLFIF